MFHILIKSVVRVCLFLQIVLFKFIFALQVLRKIQGTILVDVYDLKTPKPEHGCKIKPYHFFG